jgi:hypothetical protein
MLDYKYGGRTVRERWHEMVGTNDSYLGFCFRICVIAFCSFTAADPTTSYYMSPFMWLLVWGFVYFYL